METTNTNGQTKVAKTVTDRKAPQFVAGNPVNKVSVKAEEKTEVPPQENGQQPLKTEQPAVVLIPQAAVVPQKPALNLDQTIELLESLHVKKIQRDRLLFTINNLESFKLDLEREADETGGNYYQGCILKISDDEKMSLSPKTL